MGSDMLDLILGDQEAYMKFDAASVPANAFIPCIRRGENEEPHLSPEEEESLMIKQVTESNGFDIDFKKFRCIFNYLPFDLDSTEFVMEPETSRELMDRLSQESLERYNFRKKTKYEFVKFIKANFHMTCIPAVKYYITFEGKDPFNDQPKYFQTKVCYYYHEPADYTYCELKPEKKVHSIETAEKENVKKPRLTEEPEPLILGGEMQEVM